MLNRIFRLWRCFAEGGAASGRTRHGCSFPSVCTTENRLDCGLQSAYSRRVGKNVQCDVPVVAMAQTLYVKAEPGFEGGSGLRDGPSEWCPGLVYRKSGPRAQTDVAPSP